MGDPSLALRRTRNISSLSCANPLNDNVDGLEERDKSSADGYDFSYVMTSNVDNDIIDSLIDQERKWPLLYELQLPTTCRPNVGGNANSTMSPVLGKSVAHATPTNDESPKYTRATCLQHVLHRVVDICRNSI